MSIEMQQLSLPSVLLCRWRKGVKAVDLFIKHNVDRQHVPIGMKVHLISSDSIRWSGFLPPPSVRAALTTRVPAHDAPQRVRRSTGTPPQIAVSPTRSSERNLSLSPRCNKFISDTSFHQRSFGLDSSEESCWKHVVA